MRQFRLQAPAAPGGPRGPPAAAGTPATRARATLPYGSLSEHDVVAHPRIAGVLFVLVAEQLALDEGEHRVAFVVRGLQPAHAIGELRRAQRMQFAGAVRSDRVELLPPLRSGERPVRVELLFGRQLGDRPRSRAGSLAASGSRA